MRSFLIAATIYCGVAVTVNGGEPIAQWLFVPEYTLGQQAANYPGPRTPMPRGDQPLVEIESPPMSFRGMAPTERIRHLLPASKIPMESFSIEMWICHHVNTPVGVTVAARGVQPGSPIPWVFGFHNWETTFAIQGSEGSEVQLRSKMKPYAGYKERWIQQVITYDGHDLELTINGTRVASGHFHHEDFAWLEKLDSKEIEFELSAYMQNEPHMQWANLVNQIRIYDYPLTNAEINKRLQGLTADVDAGKLFPGLFHFTAGPYLNFARKDSMSLVCETDRPATAKIEWGKTSELGQSIERDELARKHDFEIGGLQSDTPYFYRITAVADGEDSIDSGLLTFKTAVEVNAPFKFAVIGDTEARPHINDHLAKLIWGERPNFVINLGDLTDSGKEPHRYEWTHEYFLGMNQLTSRVPLFAVPGNGEDDLYWYNHYHNYPPPEGFYQFTYGDATFFILDSNQRESEFIPGGKQYRWLDEQLTACKSKWKFVCHHHAAYTGEEDDYGNTWETESQFGDPFVQKIIPLYEKHSVDFVMFGHLHLYERSRPIRRGEVDLNDGVVYLLAGGGGGNLEDFAPTPAFFSAKTHRGHHYVTMEVAGDSIEMRMYDLEGNLKDFFTLTKAVPGRLEVQVGNR